MAIERWGSLSVKDHKNVSGLITNVLLYDRLVMPMYTESDDRDERAYWIEHDWDPDDQLARRKQLGELAVECAWDKHRRERFRDRYKAAVQLNTDANGEEITRELLIEDENHKMPEGVNHADVFVAYNSEKSSLDGIPREKAEIDQLNDYSQIGVLMAHELGVPKIDDQETALKEAINLSRDLEFRTRRAGLYEFQKTCLGQGMSPKSVVAELRDRSRDLNDYLKKQKFKVRKKACFMLAQTLLGAIGGAFIDPYMAMGGLITIWQFTDIKNEANAPLPHHLAPVAGYHDMEEVLQKYHK